MKYQEGTSTSAHISAYSLHKNVRTSRMQLSKNTLLLDSIKVFEDELVKRRVLDRGDSYPLWFTAETERNTFLWRNGESLDSTDNFEFWFDIPKLIDKRLKGSLSSSVTTICLSTSGQRDNEYKYLNELKRQFLRAGSHIHVISLVTRLAYEDVDEEAPERTLVILPGV
jgi:hypothetical protein